MKNITTASLSAIVATILISGTAQAGFGTGVIVGMALSSGNKSVVGSGDSNVLYVLPQVNERVKDPLKIKMASTYSKSFSPGSSNFGKSLEDLFKETVKVAEHCVILQAIRIVEPQNPAKAVIWFVYIEKELVAPLKKPVQTKK